MAIVEREDAGCSQDIGDERAKLGLWEAEALDQRRDERGPGEEAIKAELGEDSSVLRDVEEALVRTSVLRSARRHLMHSA